MAPTTKLEIIDYGRLSAGDRSEAAKLIDVCSKSGIFHLDFSNAEQAKQRLRDLQIIDEAQTRFFAKPLETKLKYATGVPDRGYERFDDPEVDILEVARDEQLAGTLNLPEDLTKVKQSLTSLMDFSDSILRELLSVLSSSLQPPVLISEATDATQPGKSNLGLGIAYADVGTPLMSSHADDGLLTLLFHITPFIDVRDDTSGEWVTAEMREWSHIVNVGESLNHLSNGRLRAAEHRIIQSEGPNHLVTYYLHQSK